MEISTILVLMTATAEQLLQQVLTLDERDRASIAGAIIESLEPAEPGVQEAWDAEIQRRVEELDAGTVKTVPWSEVREQLFRGFE